MTAILNTIAFIPTPGHFHRDTLVERKVLLGTKLGDQLAIAWCWRSSVGGYYHAGSKTWAVYSGPGFTVEALLEHLVGSGVVLPPPDVVDAWRLAVSKPTGAAH